MRDTNKHFSTPVVPENIMKMPADNLREVVIQFWQEQNQKEIDSTLLRDLLIGYAGLEKDLSAQNEYQRRLIAIAAHDLHNPIVSIRGLSEIILSAPDNEPLSNHRELLSAIRGAAESMQGLVSNLLELGSLDSTDFKLSFTKESLTKIVKERLTLFGTQAHKKQMTLADDCDDVPVFSFDKVRIVQVIDNLIGNAIKFSPLGSTIGVSLQNDAENTFFSVSDQGPGISDADKSKLFRSFQKLSATPTGGEKSTGLGLSITKKIVEKHHGNITVTNRPEGGCVFYVQLPMNISN